MNIIKLYIITVLDNYNSSYIYLGVINSWLLRSHFVYKMPAPESSYKHDIMWDRLISHKNLYLYNTGYWQTVNMSLELRPAAQPWFISTWKISHTTWQILYYNWYDTMTGVTTWMMSYLMDIAVWPCVKHHTVMNIL